MTKKHPIPYLVKKNLTKSANATPWKKGGIGAPSAREEILEAIKQRAQAKKMRKTPPNIL